MSLDKGKNEVLNCHVLGTCAAVFSTKHASAVCTFGACKGEMGTRTIRLRFQKGDENKMANENRNAAHFETLFSQHRRQLVRTGQKKKVHMILGVHP